MGGARRAGRGGDLGTATGSGAVVADRNVGLLVRRERPNALTTAKRQRFLDVLAATANAALAADQAGATVQAFYRRRQRDAGFAAAWTRSLEEAYQRLEQGLVAHAMSGAAGAETVAAGDGEAGALGSVPEGRPFDPQLAMKVLAIRDGRAAAPAGARRTADYRHVPIEEVERELERRLEALERRLRRRDGAVA